MDKPNKEVTIYDIAKALGVSPTTVSRALNDHFSIGKATTQAVKNLANKWGYQPNNMASGLRKNKTNTIGVVISWINRPFISSLISGIEEVANKGGYNVIISQSFDNYEKEIKNTQTLYANRVDGLIGSLAMETQKYDHFTRFQENNIPIVFADRVGEIADTDKVIIDNYAAAFEATEHLILQGCKRIAHFAGAQHRNVYRERQEGYIAALQKHNIPVDEAIILHSKLSMEDGWNNAAYLLNLDNPPDGIFSANDTSGVKAIQYAKQSGYKIPEDIAFVGFNNDPISSIVEPALTTINHPAFEMGKIACQQLLKKMQNKDIVASSNTVLKTELIVRESSKRKVAVGG